MGGLIGRNPELETIESFLTLLADGPAAVVLEGEPGIGKTTLVRAGIEAARRHGALVLSCAPSTSETRYSYAALGDLLGDVEGKALERLPAPQRYALDAALLRSAAGAAGAAGVERRAVATAVLSLLEWLAEDRPVVVAIDDLQWLDRPSARVVEFCARRLAGCVGLIASRRLGAEGVARDLIRLRDPDRLQVRELPPLDVTELGPLVREQADRPLERRMLVYLHEASGGNPFYALELARAIPAAGAPSPALPLPASLDQVVSARLEGLGEDVVEVLLAVAALADPTLGLLERALGPGAPELLDKAEAAGVVEVDGHRPRFTHPLLENGVYAQASSGRRRALHRRLSGVVSDVEEHARHLALGGVASEAIPALDEAARHVRARGAPDAAAELLELALDRGGHEELRVRAAEHHLDAGDLDRARDMLEEAIAKLQAGHARAEALMLLAELRFKDDGFPLGRDLLEQARVEAQGNLRLLMMIELRLTYVLFNLGLAPDGRSMAQSALTHAEELGDPALIAQAIAGTVVSDVGLGLPLDEQRLGRALELEDFGIRTSPELYPSWIATILWLAEGRLDEARERLDHARARLAERGEEHAVAFTGIIAAWADCPRGDLTRAETAAQESVEQLLPHGTAHGRAGALASRAHVDALAGRVDEARRGCNEALGLFERLEAHLWATAPRSTLGLLELSLGNHEAAARALEPLVEAVIATGVPDPPRPSFAGDAVEALVGVGRLEEAETVVSLLEDRGAALGRDFSVALGARGRGLICAANGDVDAAEVALERALEAHERLAMPLELARSLLVLGRIRRRLRKRRAAKEALEEALEIFERVGVPLWAQQVRAEIACLGLRPIATDALTPSEERVAALAAGGRTNREVAASLSVSQKTIEAHLARVYRKLGISSRAELGARMSQRDAEDTGLVEG